MYKKIVCVLFIVLLSINCIISVNAANTAEKSNVFGDADLDKHVDVNDVTAIQKHLVNIIELDESQLANSDVDNNNIVDIMDATKIQKYLAGIINDFNLFTVTFKNYDGTVLKSEKVASGESAIAPAYPSRDGYKFVKWDTNFNNVKSDLVVTAVYEEITEATITLSNVTAKAGNTVQVPVIVYNNPGINGMQLNISYDPKLKLIDAKNSSVLSTLNFTLPGTYSNPSKFLWDGLSESECGNGTILTLTFEVPSDLKSGDKLDISVVYPESTIYNADLDDVNFDIINGSIVII